MPAYTNPSKTNTVTFVTSTGKPLSVGPLQTVIWDEGGQALGSKGSDTLADSQIYSGLGTGAGYFQIAAGPGGATISGLTLMPGSTGANNWNGAALTAGTSYVLNVATLQLTTGSVVAYKN